MNSVGKTLMHTNSINALTISRDKTASETALALYRLYVQMQVVFLQVVLTWPRTTGQHMLKERHARFRYAIWKNTDHCSGEERKRGQEKENAEKGLIHASFFWPLQKKSGAAGTFLRGPKGCKAYRSSGRAKCPRSTISFRDSLFQYSEKHTTLWYLCFSSFGRTCFQSVFTVL